MQRVPPLALSPTAQTSPPTLSRRQATRDLIPAGHCAPVCSTSRRPATQAGTDTVIIGVTVHPKAPSPLTNRRSSMTTAKPTATTPQSPDGFPVSRPAGAPAGRYDQLQPSDHHGQRPLSPGAFRQSRDHVGGGRTLRQSASRCVTRPDCTTQTSWSPSQWTRRLTTSATGTSSQSRRSHRTSYSR